MAIGASLGGLLADRVRRRQVIALTLLVYGLVTGAAALSVSVPPLLGTDGRPLVFGVFAAAFVLATVGALFLPERRGQALIS